MRNGSIGAVSQFSRVDPICLFGRTIQPALRHADHRPLRRQIQQFSKDSLGKPLVGGPGLDELGYATCYGNGSPIEAEVAEKIRCAYGDETVKFRWEAGDVMLLDNMSVSHAREPYKGPRDVVVCMTNAYDGSDTLSGVQSGGI